MLFRSPPDVGVRHSSSNLDLAASGPSSSASYSSVESSSDARAQNRPPIGGIDPMILLPATLPVPSPPIPWSPSPSPMLHATPHQTSKSLRAVIALLTIFGAYVPFLFDFVFYPFISVSSPSSVVCWSSIDFTICRCL